jgi:hypothetical protein
MFGTLATVSLLKSQTAPLSTPKQGIAKPSGGENGKAQTQPQDSKQPTPNAVPPSQQPTAPTCDEGCQQGRQNLAIQGKLEWFTGVLAVVGVLQVGTMVWQAGLLRGTLNQIHVQAGHMESQTKILSDSVAAAQESIASMKAKERARLTVTPVGFDPPAVVPYDFSYMLLEITNDGFSGALNVSARGEVVTTPSGELPKLGPEYGREIPSFLKPNAPPVMFKILFVDEHELDKMDLTPMGSTSKSFLTQIVGIIEYDDVFGDRHETRFCYSFIPYSVEIKEFGGGWKSWFAKSSSGWVKKGPPEYNHAT